MTLVAPFGRSGDMGCRVLEALIGERVSNNASTVVIYNAANRPTAVARRRGLSMVGYIMSRATKRVPMVTKANTGYARGIVSFSRGIRGLNMSNLLIIAPCCGGTARGNLCTRCTTVTKTIKLPVVVCGMPSHANYGVLPRATTELNEGFRGVMKVGRTDNGVSRITGLGGLTKSSLSVCSKGSSRIVPVLSLNKVNIVSMLSGMVPTTIRSVMAGCLGKGVGSTLSVRLGCLSLVRTLFYRIGPVPMGTTVGLLKCSIKKLHLPLARLRSTGHTELGRDVRGLGKG